MCQQGRVPAHLCCLSSSGGGAIRATWMCLEMQEEPFNHLLRWHDNSGKVNYIDDRARGKEFVRGVPFSSEKG